LFEFLEASTVKSVRFTDFSYSFNDNNKNFNLSMNGEARGYASLALQADIFSESGNFTDLTFSNLTLDDRGNVQFSINAVIDPTLVSYKKLVEDIGVPPAEPPAIVEDESATSTDSTSSSQVATTTPN